ncbi:hypothetical protein ACF0H5_008947 [Mactra antiquata]
MDYTRIFLISLVGILSRVYMTETADIILEAEDMLGDVKHITDRSKASGAKTIHLYGGETIHTEICLIQEVDILEVGIGYTNDGGSDLIEVKISEVVYGHVLTDVNLDKGNGWNDVSYENALFRAFSLVGRKQLAIVIAESDKYGVEIDYIKIKLNDSQVTEDSFLCRVFCFEDIVYNSTLEYTTKGRAEQRSSITTCAEEDNVNIPIFHDNPRKFTITAQMPKYQTFKNNRHADWSQCEFNTEYWKFTDINFLQNQFMTWQNDKLNLTMSKLSPFHSHGTRKIAQLDFDFELDGPSIGSTESEAGTLLVIKDLQFQGQFVLRYQYFNRYNVWSQSETKIVKEGETEVEFVSPDFSFREGSGNKIRIKVFSDQKSTSGIKIGTMYLRVRWLKPGKTTILFQDQTTVIEGVDMDMWWRTNETMNVILTNKKESFTNVDFLRIYQRVPWTDASLSQTFVLYQDGNVRLLPLTPHGLDWIPFGSSVLIGQTDLHSTRPSAPISHLHIDPFTLNMKIFYKDGGTIKLDIKSEGTRTSLMVSESHFTSDLNVSPFVTFRSMFVENGNGDVDHLSIDSEGAVPIIGSWKFLHGNYFAFHRKCISKHNTLSPDIIIRIN